MENAKYLEEILEKYDFISKLYISDTEGNIINSIKRIYNPDFEEIDKKFRLTAANVYNNTITQIKDGVNLNTKGITSFFDDLVVYQSKINNTFFIQIICNTEDYNHSIIEELIQELKFKLEKIEKEVETVKKEADN